MDFEKNNWFDILYHSQNFKDEKRAEILLLIYEEEKDREAENLVIKVREAPRKFRNLSAVQFESAKLYYWSTDNGPALLTPQYKMKDGIIRIDLQECIQYARKQSQLLAGKEQDIDWEQFYKIINQWRYYKFDKNGYCFTEDKFSSDWATAECTVCYGEKTFAIGEREILMFEVESHWIVEEAWEQLEQTMKGGAFSRRDLENWIALLDSYDTHVHIWYKEGENAKETRLVLRDHKRYREFDVEW